MQELVIFLIMLCLVLATIIIYRKREKKLIERLQKMIDFAAEGESNNFCLDESTLSALENSMHRFLEARTMSSEKSLIEKQKVQTLISDISHQSITPISNILLYAEILEERDISKEYKEEVMAIKEQSEKLNFLIDSLVKMSRLESGIIAVNLKPIKVNNLIETVIKQTNIKALQKEIFIEYIASEAEVICDFKWTAEALYNILDNSIKYSEQGGKVKISISAYNFFCKIDVTDNGIGIEGEEINKIFERFYRSKNVSEEDGVGIGLFLAREIIAVQSGYMGVSSEFRRGSTFSVYIPMG